MKFLNLHYPSLSQVQLYQAGIKFHNLVTDANFEARRHQAVAIKRSKFLPSRGLSSIPGLIASLKCFACSGTGKVKNLMPKPHLGNFCCGIMLLGNYCSSCGKSLKSLCEPPNETNCMSCNGTDKALHVCIFKTYATHG